MKKLFLVANWKSHKSAEEAHTFMISFFSRSFIEWYHHLPSSEKGRKIIVVCPPTFLISQMSQMLSSHPTVPVQLGSQDISPFSQGAYTGEESAEQLADFVTFSIVGHSERRQFFGETDEMVAQKVKEARAFQIEPIVCVQGEKTPVPDGTRILAYEPLDAIGTGRPASPEDAEKVAQFFKEKYGVQYVLYGGSVTAENVHTFTALPSLNGVLIGGASLDPHQFSEIIQRS